MPDAEYTECPPTPQCVIEWACAWIGIPLEDAAAVEDVSEAADAVWQIICSLGEIRWLGGKWMDYLPLNEAMRPGDKERMTRVLVIPVPAGSAEK